MNADALRGCNDARLGDTAVLGRAPLNPTLPGFMVGRASSSVDDRSDAAVRVPESLFVWFRGHAQLLERAMRALSGDNDAVDDYLRRERAEYPYSDDIQKSELRSQALDAMLRSMQQ